MKVHPSGEPTSEEAIGHNDEASSGLSSINRRCLQVNRRMASVDCTRRRAEEAPLQLNSLGPTQRLQVLHTRRHPSHHFIDSLSHAGLSPRQITSIHATLFQPLSDHLTSCYHISVHGKSPQFMPPYFNPCQITLSHATLSQSMENHLNSCHHISTHVKSLYLMLPYLSPWQITSIHATLFQPMSDHFISCYPSSVHGKSLRLMPSYISRNFKIAKFCIHVYRDKF